jgi:hypothetical protein
MLGKSGMHSDSRCPGVISNFTKLNQVAQRRKDPRLHFYASRKLGKVLLLVELD